MLGFPYEDLLVEAPDCLIERQVTGNVHPLTLPLLRRHPSRHICSFVSVSCRIVRLDRLCDLVVRFSGYRFKGPGSIPGATRFSEK
jgi:hypothetical protein